MPPHTGYWIGSNLYRYLFGDENNALSVTEQFGLAF